MLPGQPFRATQINYNNCASCTKANRSLVSGTCRAVSPNLTDDCRRQFGAYVVTRDIDLTWPTTVRRTIGSPRPGRLYHSLLMIHSDENKHSK